MSVGDVLPAILVDEIGLCHLRKGTIVAKTAFEPMFAFDGDHLSQMALQARTECYIAGQLVRGSAGAHALASGDPAFDLACGLAHIRNFATVEEAGGRLYVELPCASDFLFEAFVNRLEEEFEFGWIDPTQIVVALSSRGEISRSAGIAARLRDFGIGVCLADFGAAAAASALVESLRPEMVQFDAGWVRSAAGLDPARRLLGSLVGILRDRAISVMLDGIEDEAELDIACRAGIDILCGPFLAPAFAAGVAETHRPMPERQAAGLPTQGAEIIQLRG